MLPDEQSTAPADQCSAPSGATCGQYFKCSTSILGRAAAWSPNPQSPPLFFDRPIVDGKVVPAIAAKWIANSPLAMIDQYVPNLKSYKAIALDVGLQDTLLGSVREMDASLTRLNLAHTFETYEGDHTNHLKDRVELKVLPFFSQHLNFNTKKSGNKR
ncbi:MAG: hypothetical protein WDO18_17160 [Acidobacteriota bacterium]